jgi:uncharacterized protein YxeA
VKQTLTVLSCLLYFVINAQQPAPYVSPGAKQNKLSWFDLTSARSNAGIFKKSGGGYGLWLCTSWDDFKKKDLEQKGHGTRLLDFTTFKEQGIRKYLGVWVQSNLKTEVITGLKYHDFVSSWERYSKNNFRLIDVETYEEYGERFYAAIYQEGTDAYFLWMGVDYNGILSKVKELETSLRLTKLTSYLENGERKYIGVWREGAGEYYVASHLNWDKLLQANNDLSARNLNMTTLDSYQENGVRYFTAIWRYGSEQIRLVNSDWENFVTRWHKLLDDGFRLFSICN